LPYSSGPSSSTGSRKDSFRLHDTEDESMKLLGNFRNYFPVSLPTFQRNEVFIHDRLTKIKKS
jgi:hypothetical protein